MARNNGFDPWLNNRALDARLLGHEWTQAIPQKHLLLTVFKGPRTQPLVGIDIANWWKCRVCSELPSTRRGLRRKRFDLLREANPMKTSVQAPKRRVSTLDQDLAERVSLFLQMKRPEIANLLVSAVDGEIRLRGSVGSYDLRQLAISVAQHVAGVLRVIDRIEVQEHLPFGSTTTPARSPK